MLGSDGFKLVSSVLMLSLIWFSSEHCTPVDVFDSFVWVISGFSVESLGVALDRFKYFRSLKQKIKIINK